MSSQLQKRKSVVREIGAGIARRGFQIIPAIEEIPGCPVGKGQQREWLQDFAREHGWHVTIHDENGWLLFTKNPRPPTGETEGDLGRLSELMMRWLFERRFNPKSVGGK